MAFDRFAEPVLGISLIARTGSWLKSGVLNFPHEHLLLLTYFGKSLRLP